MTSTVLAWAKDPGARRIEVDFDISAGGATLLSRRVHLRLSGEGVSRLFLFVMIVLTLRVRARLQLSK